MLLYFRFDAIRIAALLADVCNIGIYFFRILVMDDGHVAEFDAPNTLLMNKQSMFYGLARDAGILSKLPSRPA